MDDEGYNIGSK